MISSVSKYLNTVLSEEDIDISPRVGKFDAANTKPRGSEMCLL